MRRKMTVLITLALAVGIFAPSLALAAIEGSVHDILTYSATLPKKSGSCSQCHIPHKAGGDKLFGITSTAGTGWLAASQPISLVCYYCHNGGSSFVRTGGGAQEVNPFGATNKHGYTIATLTGMGDIASMPSDVVVQDSATIKCTSCHDVHTNTTRPFLREFGRTAGSTDLHTFCIKCHPSRSNVGSFGTANPGNHPTNQLIADTAGTNSPMQATVNAAFRVAIASPTSISAGNWNLGGHLSDGTTSAATGNYNCGTCHAVHGNETTDFTSAADGNVQVTAETTGFNNLLVMSQATPTGTAAPEPVCVGCHNFTVTAGPGSTGTYSHPIGTPRTAWTITGIATPTGVRWGSDGTNNVINCESCHDIHFTVADAAGAPGGVEGTGASAAYLINVGCDGCHGTGVSQAGHHPSGVAVTAGTSYRTGAVISTATDWSARSQTQTTTAYVFTGGVMGCGTCHNGGSAKAHNNGGGLFPGLVGTIAESDMCVDCHGFNPSVYTTNVFGAASAAPHSSSVTDDATHYVGPITTTVGTKYRRTANFSSGAAPKWSTDGTSGYSVICESCHTLKFNTVTPRTSANKTALTGERSLSVGLLLEASGNNLSVYDQSGATPPTGTVDLCTGCHGPAPGGSGTTHPSLATMTTTISTAITIGNPFTTSSNNRINCDSCHRPHDAAPGSGALILESCGTDSTRSTWQGATVNAGGYTNEGGANFCSRCHTAY